jgi:hypothetical protein
VEDVGLEIDCWEVYFLNTHFIFSFSSSDFCLWGVAVPMYHILTCYEYVLGMLYNTMYLCMLMSTLGMLIECEQIRRIDASRS